MIRLFGALALLAIGSGLPDPADLSDPPSKPNLVVILADDLGYGDLGCYGHPRFKTPNLDRMASEGVRLTQLNTPTPFCAPTRAALMTGRYPFRCGLTTNPTPDGGPAADATVLPLVEVTLAQILRGAGYATGMVGKWHLGHKRPEYLPTRRGFDEYLGIPYSNDMRPVRLLEGEREIAYPVVQATLTRRYTERALRFIERNRDRPFFLYFAHAMPHKPLACSEAFYKKSGAGLYGDVLAELDWSVGQVLAKLKHLGLDQRTLVVFTSDNGPWYGGSTGGLRGMKSTTWEGGFRVPCIVRWPGRLSAGTVCRELAVTMDLFATALAAAGVPPPRDRVIDGTDLFPLFSGKEHAAHAVVFGHQGPHLATVRDGRWKLHLLPARNGRQSTQGQRWLDPRGPDGVTILAPYEQSQPIEFPGLRTGDETRAMSLFDLESDPGEQHDVSAQHGDIVARLKARYDQVVKDFPAVATDRPVAAPKAAP
jgi:arylsulfatase A-like enzyme